MAKKQTIDANVRTFFYKNQINLEKTQRKQTNDKELLNK